MEYRSVFLAENRALGQTVLDNGTRLWAVAAATHGNPISRSPRGGGKRRAARYYLAYLGMLKFHRVLSSIVPSLRSRRTERVNIDVRRRRAVGFVAKIPSHCYHRDIVPLLSSAYAYRSYAATGTSDVSRGFNLEKIAVAVIN